MKSKSKLIKTILFSAFILTAIGLAEKSGGVPCFQLQSGKPYKIQDQPGVYFITDQCTKKAFPDPQVFFSYFSSYKAIVKTTIAELSRIPYDDEPVMKLRCPLTEGLPYKLINSSGIYLVTVNCTKQAFASPAVYFSYFSSYGQAARIGKNILDLIPDDVLKFAPMRPEGNVGLDYTARGILTFDRATVWDPGIPGGVPRRNIICTTINASEFGDGRSEASRAIQKAIDSCPSGQVVQLSKGVFTVNDHFIIRKDITVRGAGAGITKVQKTNGAKSNSDTSGDGEPVIIIGPTRWPRINEAKSQNLIAEGVKGEYFVKVNDAAGFSSGQIVLLDEDHYSVGFWQSLPTRNGKPTSVQIWGTDRINWKIHNPREPGDDPVPDALGWFSRFGRPIGEVKEIKSVAGNTITFTTPLHISYRPSYKAQLTPYIETHVKFAGVEDLTVSGGGNGNIRFEAAAYSWMKGVESTIWLGEGVSMDKSFRIEVRDSYVHDTAWPVPGGGGYALSLSHSTAEVLIENNIVMGANKLMVARSSGAGTVVGYNYMDNGFIADNKDWVEVGINGSHMAGSHHMLFEGNESFNFDSDFTHGNSIYHTVFRNHLTGFRRDYPGMGNARTVGLEYGSWWHSFVGNVLGSQNKMNGWLYEDPGNKNGNRNPWDLQNFYIWRLGYDSTRWDQSFDPKVRSTVLREGNFDHLTNEIRWSGSQKNIPQSLYLKKKPDFFGSRTWPWVDPVSGKTYELPAKSRFEAGKPFLGG